MKHCKTFATLPWKYESLSGCGQDASDTPRCLSISIFSIRVTKVIPRRSDWWLLYYSKKMVQYWEHRWFNTRIYSFSSSHKFIFQYSGQCIRKQQNVAHTPIRTVLMKNFIQAICYFFLGSVNCELSWIQKVFAALNYLLHLEKPHKMKLLKLFENDLFPQQWFIFPLENPFYKREYD